MARVEVVLVGVLVVVVLVGVLVVVVLMGAGSARGLPAALCAPFTGGFIRVVRAVRSLPAGLSGCFRGRVVGAPTVAVGACAQGVGPATGGWVLRIRALVGANAAVGCDHGIGRHLVGRAPTACVPVRAPGVAPHQVSLVLEASGHLRVRRLGGGAVVRLEGADLGGGEHRVPPGSMVVLEVGGVLLGLCTLRLPPVAGVPGRDASPGAQHPQGAAQEPGTRVIRGPRPLGTPPLVRVRVASDDPPAPAPPSPISLVAAGVGLLGGLVMAAVLGTWLFAMFAVIGALTASLTWGLTRLRARRLVRRGATRAAIARRVMLHEVLLATEAALVAAQSQAPELIDVDTARHRGLLWARRPEHGDAFDVTVGLGATPPPVEFATDTGPQPGPADLAAVHSVVAEVTARMGRPEVIALDAGAPQVLAVTGPVADAVVRAMVVQLAVGTGPADLRLVALSARPERYAWMRGLPHSAVPGVISDAPDVIDLRDAAAAAIEVMRLDDGDPRRLVVVTDHAEGLTYRTSPLRRLLDRHRAITVVVDLPPGAPVPAICAPVILTDPSRSLGVSVATATEVMAGLVGLEDPEDARLAATALAVQVDLDALLADLRTPAQIRARWAAGGSDPAPAAVIGRSADAVLEVDLVADGPHGLVAGTTGAGKSELLRSLVLSLALRVAPAHLQFVLIDYKGGSTFDAAADLPHTVGLVTDLDEGRAERALVSLEAELRRRERLLRAVGAADLRAYRAQPEVAPLARLVVVIDEFAALAHELPGFLAALVGVAQRGRSLGIHLLLATQRPAGVIDDAIRANTDLRIALRLNDVADARDVVGDDRPVGFPRGVPGRSLLRLGADEGVVFQAASSAGIMRARVEAVIAAADGFAAPHRPWLPALDDLMVARATGGEHDGLGLVDDPEGQAQHVLTWDRSGSLALIGALGSGTTTTLLALLHEILATDAAVVFVLDAAGDPRLAPLAGAAGCAGVVAVHERERVDRLLGLWCAEIDGRRRGEAARDRAGERPDWVLAVDDLMALRRSLDDTSAGGWSATAVGRWDRILAEGPGVGLVVLGTLDATGGGAAVMAGRCAQRWVHHLEDPADGPLFGVGAALVPPDIPGRIRLAASGLEAQIWPPAPVADRPSRWPVPVIGTLASEVWVADLSGAPGGSTLPPGVLPPGVLQIGLGYEDLGLDGPEMLEGDHLMVLGAPRSGRTTALGSVAAAWRLRHPQGRVQVLLARRGPSPLCEWGEVMAGPEWGAAGDDGPRLVLVDDADRLGEGDARWEQWVLAAPAGTTICAAARPEVLRGMFGHWTTVLRRSRTALVMTLGAEAGADLLGAVIPRHHPLRPRPGLAWVVDAAGTRLMQIARVPASGEHVGDHPGPQFGGEAQ